MCFWGFFNRKEFMLNKKKHFNRTISLSSIKTNKIHSFTRKDNQSPHKTKELPRKHKIGPKRSYLFLLPMHKYVPLLGQAIPDELVGFLEMFD